MIDSDLVGLKLCFKERCMRSWRKGKNILLIYQNGFDHRKDSLAAELTLVAISWLSCRQSGTLGEKNMIQETISVYGLDPFQTKTGNFAIIPLP